MHDLHLDDQTFWQNVDCYIDARQSLMIFYSSEFKGKILIDGNHDIEEKLLKNIEETKNLALMVGFFKSIETLCYYVITNYVLQQTKNITIFEKIRNDKLNDVIECFAKKIVPPLDKKYFDIDLVNNILNYDEFIYDALLLGEDIKINLMNQKIRENCVSIPEFISNCCKFYHNHKEFYNKYKHGNRIYPEKIILEVEASGGEFVKLIENTMHHHFTEKNGIKNFNFLKMTNKNLIVCTINCCIICEVIRCGKLKETSRNVNFEIPYVDMGENFSLKFST